ncbi:MAG TPA: hypothetical protein VGL98_09755 [Gammaproteobacteria bacterium]
MAFGVPPDARCGQQMRPIVMSVIGTHEDAVDVVSYIGTLRAH